MNREHAIVLFYALVALAFIPVFPHFPSPNEFTRWTLVASVVEEHTVEVSHAAALLGPQFEDLEVIDGRQYSNKAPGTALIAAPGYLAARPLLGAPRRDNLRPMLTAMRWSAATLPLLALALLFAREARGRGAASAPFALAALLFGTPLFAYGLLLFSHAAVAATLFGAWVLLYLRDRGGVAAGALIGLAVMSEYPSAIAAAVLIVGLLVMKRWERAALVIAGGVPFAVVLALYQRAAFGSVFASSYAHEKLGAYRQLTQTGFFGIHLPSPAIAFDILFHPARGLFIFSPILIVCLIALRDARRALPRAAFITLILAPLALFLVYAGYPNWHGGWNVGPRYVVAILPFAVFPLAFARVRACSVALFGASVTAVMLTTLTFPFVPLQFPLPWGSLGMPLIAHGLIAPNLGHLIGRPVAFALLFLGIIAAIAVVTPRKLLLAGVIGLAIAVAAGLAAARAASRRALPTVERIYFEDVYFGRRGELDAAVRGRLASPSLLARRAAELPYGPTDWPF